MTESISDEPRNELINSEGWLFSISLSFLTFLVIFFVGSQISPDDDNLLSLVWVGGLIGASKVLASWFPRQLSFRRPSCMALIIAVLAAFGIHAVFWLRPLMGGFLNHYYSYELFGRIIYVIIFCAIQYVRFTKITEAIRERLSHPMQSTPQHQPVLSKKPMNKLLAVIIAILVMVWLIPTLIAAFDRELFLWFVTYGKTVQLAPSSQNGKFIYVHSGKIRFSADPQYPVYISIRKEVHDGLPPEPEKTITISSGDQYTIEADLEPGEYEIHSSFNPKDEYCSDDGKYKGAFGGHIRIRKNGLSKTEEQPIIYYLKMRIIAPDNKSFVTEKRPTLRWEPVPGAHHYKVNWRNDKRDFGHEITTSPEFTFGKDIEPSTVYKWEVEAFNKSGEKIAYYSQPSFRTTSQ
jgi:hypothetical protein